MTKRAILLYVAVIGICLSIPLSSCVSDHCKDPANATEPACVAENVIADCTGSDVQTVIHNAEPIIAQHIENGIGPDGTLNYSAIEADLVADVIKFGECAVSDVWSKYFSTPSPVPGPVTPPSPPDAGVGSGSSEPPRVAAHGHKFVKPESAKAAFDTFRAKHFTKNKIKTSGAVL